MDIQSPVLARAESLPECANTSLSSIDKMAIAEEEVRHSMVIVHEDGEISYELRGGGSDESMQPNPDEDEWYDVESEPRGRTGSGRSSTRHHPAAAARTHSKLTESATLPCDPSFLQDGPPPAGTALASSKEEGHLSVMQALGVRSRSTSPRQGWNVIGKDSAAWALSTSAPDDSSHLLAAAMEKPGEQPTALPQTGFRIFGGMTAGATSSEDSATSQPSVVANNTFVANPTPPPPAVPSPAAFTSHATGPHSADMGDVSPPSQPSSLLGALLEKKLAPQTTPPRPDSTHPARPRPLARPFPRGRRRPGDIAHQSHHQFGHPCQHPDHFAGRGHGSPTSATAHPRHPTPHYTSTASHVQFPNHHHHHHHHASTHHASNKLPAAAAGPDQGRHHHHHHHHVTRHHIQYEVGHMPAKTREAFDAAPGCGPGYSLDPEFLKRYYVGEPLGKGATAIVLAAVRIKDGLDVAIKMIFKDRIPPSALKRDRSLGVIPIEAFILKRISHKNIVRFLDVFEDPNFYFVVMEAAHAIHNEGLVAGGGVGSSDHDEAPPSPTALSLVETLNWARECSAQGVAGEGLGEVEEEHHGGDDGTARNEGLLSAPAVESSRMGTLRASMTPTALASLGKHVSNTSVPSSSSAGTSSANGDALGMTHGGTSLKHLAHHPTGRRSSRQGSPTRTTPPPAASHNHHHRALPRCPSRDLFEVIERNPTMPERTVRYIFAQIVDAVAHLHGMGFVHRDIKDENVIIDDALSVKLIDFGAARAIPASRGEYFEEFCGTMVYCPPELLGLARAAAAGGGGASVSVASSRTASMQSLAGGGGGSHGASGDQDPAQLPGGSAYRYRGPEQDVFSLGVLLYVLLEAMPPYTTSSDRRERPRALAWWVGDGEAGGAVSGAAAAAGTTGPVPMVRSRSGIGVGGWGRRSEACRDLVWRLLEPDPDARIGIADVKAHRWLATSVVE
ncbi:hypothetical protein HDU96_006714 [Phlyctochytrium bullatum]|nr:hypothetical protein HDU96_006714 [Phlyctochytrium bullatum]